MMKYGQDKDENFLKPNVKRIKANTQIQTLQK